MYTRKAYATREAPRRGQSDDQLEAREGQARRFGVAEGFVVPLKLGNAGGGKGRSFASRLLPPAGRRSRNEGDRMSSTQTFRENSGSGDALLSLVDGIIRKTWYEQHVSPPQAKPSQPTMQRIAER